MGGLAGETEVLGVGGIVFGGETIGFAGATVGSAQDVEGSAVNFSSGGVEVLLLVIEVSENRNAFLSGIRNIEDYQKMCAVIFTHQS